jgi:hypothetical protein
MKEEYWIELHYDNGAVKTFSGNLNYTYEIYANTKKFRKGKHIREPQVQRIVAGCGNRKSKDENLLTDIVT